jgi:hypothetical protein
VPTHFYFRYRYKNMNFNANPAEPSTGLSYCYMAYISSGGCDPNSISEWGPTDMSQSTGDWIQGGNDGTTPSGTVSVMIACQAVVGTGYYDQIYLGTSIPPTSGF